MHSGIFLMHLTFLKQNEDGLAEFFENVVKQTQMKPKKVIGWIINDLLSHLKQHSLTVKERSGFLITTVAKQKVIYFSYTMNSIMSLPCSLLL